MADLNDLKLVRPEDWVAYMLEHDLAASEGEATEIAEVLLTGEGDVVEGDPPEDGTD